MANVKQLNMLSAKARKAGMEFDREAAKDLTNEEIDALVAKFDANGGKQEQTVKPENVDAVKELNGQRFGMIYKIVIEHDGYLWARNNKEEFIKRVVEGYNLSAKAEAAVLASSSSPSKVTEKQEAQYRKEFAQRYACEHSPDHYGDCKLCGINLEAAGLM